MEKGERKNDLDHRIGHLRPLRIAASLLTGPLDLRRGHCGLSKSLLGWPSPPRPASHGPTPHGKNAYSEGEPMEVLSEQEIALILQRLETYVADLEHDVSARTFYAFVLVAQALAGRKHALCTMTHIRTCVSLAHRMRAIRQALLPDALPWTPLTDVLELIHAEATRLTSLYGVARPECRTQRRALQQAFRAAFTHATGKAYQQYGP